MFEFLLDSASAIRQVPYETVGDKLAVGAEVTLRGMGTVFAVLVMIWMLVEVLHLILGDKKKKQKKAVVIESITTPTVSPSVNEVTTTESQAPDYELIAVISAAVAAASGASPSSFRVVSFKRANNKFSSGK